MTLYWEKVRFGSYLVSEKRAGLQFKLLLWRYSSRFVCDNYSIQKLDF